MKKIKFLVLVCMLIAAPIITNAQPGGDEDVVDVPVDGGVSLLLVIGTVLGIQKLKSKSTDWMIDNNK
jgi:hypothetical protein